MIIIEGVDGNKVYLFKHLEQGLLKALTDFELESIRSGRHLIGVYFGGPMELIETRVDFTFGRLNNILNKNSLHIPHINLTGADFVHANPGDSIKYDLIGIFNSSPLKRHLYFLEIAGHFENTALYTYGSHRSISRLIDSIEKEKIRINTEIYFGVEELRDDVFPWSSQSVGDFLKKSKVFLLTSKSEGVNRAAVYAARLGIPVVIAKDCKGDTFEYLRENGYDVFLFTSVHEAVDKIRLLVGDDGNSLNIKYNEKPLNDFKKFLLLEFNFITNLNILRSNNAERLIASHGKTLSNRRSSRDDMFTSLLELKKFFGLRSSIKDYYREIISSIIRHLIEIRKSYILSK